MAELQVIARVRSPFHTKFGVPRQSGLVPVRAQLVPEPGFRSAEAWRGLEEFSHLWLIWGFSQSAPSASLTVRPPRLGGNRRVGVFATRAPFRPNGLGLSCVELERIDWQTAAGPLLHILGADMADGTPVYDIKPYVPYTDSRPKALGGFADEPPAPRLHVVWPADCSLPADTRDELTALLALDPRPAYHEDGGRDYGLDYDGWTLRFRVIGDELRVESVVKL